MEFTTDRKSRLVCISVKDHSYKALFYALARLLLFAQGGTVRVSERVKGYIKCSNKENYNDKPLVKVHAKH